MRADRQGATSEKLRSEDVARQASDEAPRTGEVEPVLAWTIWAAAGDSAPWARLGTAATYHAAVAKLRELAAGLLAAECVYIVLPSAALPPRFPGAGKGRRRSERRQQVAREAGPLPTAAGTGRGG